MICQIKVNIQPMARETLYILELYKGNSQQALRLFFYNDSIPTIDKIAESYKMPALKNADDDFKKALIESIEKQMKARNKEFAGISKGFCIYQPTSPFLFEIQDGKFVLLES